MPEGIFRALFSNFISGQVWEMHGCCGDITIDIKSEANRSDRNFICAAARSGNAGRRDTDF